MAVVKPPFFYINNKYGRVTKAVTLFLFRLPLLKCSDTVPIVEHGFTT